MSHVKSPAARRFLERPPEEREKLIETLLKGKERKTMYKLFVEDKPVRIVAVETYYTERNVYRTYKRALETIERAIDEGDGDNA
jgi:hypothetical protein